MQLAYKGEQNFERMDFNKIQSMERQKFKAKKRRETKYSEKGDLLPKNDVE